MIDPVIAENKVVIIAEEGDEEKVATLKSLLDKHDLPEAEITVSLVLGIYRILINRRF